MTQEQLIALVNSKLADYSNIVPSEHREVEIAIINAIFESIPTSTRMKYEVIEIDVNLTERPTFLVDNFTSTGLGKGDYLGYAICNGQNGTKDRGGKVAIGYDQTNYPNIGATGGSKDAVLVEHSHEIAYQGHNAAGGGSEWVLDNSSASTTVTSTKSAGVSGVGKNMQPYIVTLFIQKL